MARKGNAIKRILFQLLPFHHYLLLVSRLYFISYYSGLLRRKDFFKYHHFLNKLIHPGDVVIDIGANLGYFSRLFCRWTSPGGHVYAVEPIRDMYEVLEKNTRKCRNLSLMPYALGEEEKTIELANSSRAKQGFISSGKHFVLDDKSRKEGEELDCFPAEMKKGSKLFEKLERLNFIKCDVEGYESVILPEIAPVIKKHRPVLLVETGGANRKKTIALLAAMDYQALLLYAGKLYPIDEAPQSKEDDILFVPLEQHGKIEQYMR